MRGKLALVALAAAFSFAILLVPNAAAQASPTISAKVGSDLWLADTTSDFDFPENGPAVPEAAPCGKGPVFPILVRTTAATTGADGQWFKIGPTAPHYLDVQRRGTQWKDEIEVKAEPYGKTTKGKGNSDPLLEVGTTGLKFSMVDRTGGMLKDAQITFFIALDGSVEDTTPLTQPYNDPPSAAELYKFGYDPLHPNPVWYEVLQELLGVRASTPLVDELGLVDYVPELQANANVPKNYAPAIAVAKPDRGAQTVDPTAPHCWASITFATPPDGRLPASMEVILDRPDDGDATHARTHVVVKPQGSPASLEMRAAIFQGTTSVLRDAVPLGYTAHSPSAPPPQPPPTYERVRTLTWDDKAAAEGFHAEAFITKAPALPTNGYDLTILSTERRQAYEPGLRIQWAGPQVGLDLRMDLRRANEGPASMQVVTPQMPTDMGVCYDATSDGVHSALKYDASSPMPWLFFRHTSREADSSAFGYVEANLTNLPSHLMFLKSTTTTTSSGVADGYSSVSTTNETSFGLKTKFSVPCLSNVGSASGLERIGLSVAQGDVEAKGRATTAVGSIPLEGPDGGLPDGAFFRLKGVRQDAGGAVHAREMRMTHLDYAAPGIAGKVKFNLSESRWGQLDRFSDFTVDNLPREVHLSIVNRTLSPGTVDEENDLGIDLDTDGTTMGLVADSREFSGGQWVREINFDSSRIPSEILLNFTSRPAREALPAGGETAVSFDASSRTNHINLTQRDRNERGSVLSTKVDIDGLPSSFDLVVNARRISYSSPEGIDDLVFLQSFNGASITGWPLEAGNVRIEGAAKGGHIQHLKAFEHLGAPHSKATDPTKPQYVNGTFTQKVPMSVFFGGSTTVRIPSLSDDFHFVSDFQNFIEWDASASIDRLEIDLASSTQKWVRGSAALKEQFGTDKDTWWKNATTSQFVIDGLPKRIDVTTNFQDRVLYDADSTTRYVSLNFTLVKVFSIGDTNWLGPYEYARANGSLALGNPTDAFSVAVPKHFEFTQVHDTGGSYQTITYTADGEITKANVYLNQFLKGTAWEGKRTVLHITAAPLPKTATVKFQSNPAMVKVTSTGIDSLDVYLSDRDPAKGPRAAPAQAVKNFVHFEKDLTGYDLWGHVDGLKALVFQLDASGTYSSPVNIDGVGGGLIADVALVKEIPFHIFVRAEENGHVPDPKPSVRIDVNVNRINLDSIPKWCAEEIQFLHPDCIALHLDTDFSNYDLAGELTSVVLSGCVQKVFLDENFACREPSDLRLKFEFSTPRSLQIETSFQPSQPVAVYVSLYAYPGLTIDQAEIFRKADEASELSDLYFKASDFVLPTSTTFMMGRPWEGSREFGLWAATPGVSGDVVIGTEDKQTQTFPTAMQDVRIQKLAAKDEVDKVSLHVEGVRRVTFCPEQRLSGFPACKSFSGGAILVETEGLHRVNTPDLHFSVRQGTETTTQVDVKEGLPSKMSLQFSDGWQHLETNAPSNLDGTVRSPARLFFAPYLKVEDVPSPRVDKESKSEIILRSIPKMLDLRSAEYPYEGECYIWGLPTSETRVKTDGRLDIAMLDVIKFNYEFASHETGWVFEHKDKDQLRKELPAPSLFAGVRMPDDAEFTRIVYTTYGGIDVTEYSYDWWLDIWARKTGELLGENVDAHLNICGSLHPATNQLPDGDDNAKGMRAYLTGHLTGNLLTTWESDWRGTPTSSVVSDENRANGNWRGDLLIGFADTHQPSGRVDAACPDEGRGWLKFWVSGFTKLTQSGSTQACMDGGITMFSYGAGGVGTGHHGAWDLEKAPNNPRVSTPYEDNVCDGDYQTSRFRGDPTLFGYEFWHGKFRNYDSNRRSCLELKNAAIGLDQFPEFIVVTG